MCVCGGGGGGGGGVRFANLISSFLNITKDWKGA